MKVIVEYKDTGKVEIYDDVTRIFINTRNELDIKMWWSGEQTASEYIPMCEVETFYINESV